MPRPKGEPIGVIDNPRPRPTVNLNTRFGVSASAEHPHTFHSDDIEPRMESLSSAIASILDIGKYLSSIVKALEDISNYRTHSLERRQEREYLVLSAKILKNLDHMLYDRMFIVRELRDSLAYLDRKPALEFTPDDESIDEQVNLFQQRLGSMAWRIGGSSSSVAELCALTEYVLPNSVFGMEMKKLMMATKVINTYFLENLDRFAFPTPEFISVLRSVHDAHSVLSHEFFNLMEKIDADAVNNAFARFKAQ